MSHSPAFTSTMKLLVYEYSNVSCVLREGVCTFGTQLACRQHGTLGEVRHRNLVTAKFQLLRDRLKGVGMSPDTTGRWQPNFKRHLSHHTDNCAKSLQAEAPCGSAVHGSWTEMSPAPPLPLPDPSPLLEAGPPPPLEAGGRTPPVDSMTGGRQGGQGRIDEQGRIDDITDTTRTSHCSCLEHCFLFGMSSDITLWRVIQPNFSHMMGDRGHTTLNNLDVSKRPNFKC